MHGVWLDLAFLETDLLTPKKQKAVLAWAALSNRGAAEVTSLEDQYLNSSLTCWVRKHLEVIKLFRFHSPCRLLIFYQDIRYFVYIYL